jgi:hypothetical protein
MTALDLDAIKARASRAQQEVESIALRGGAQRWRMSIPARPDRDSDLIISAALNDLDDLIGLREHQPELTRTELEFLADFVGGTGNDWWGEIAAHLQITARDVEVIFQKLRRALSTNQPDEAVDR